MKQYAGEILRVHPEGLGAELGLVAGDKILAVNGQHLRDIIDLSFAMADEEIELLVEHTDGTQECIAFDKDMDEELDVEFKSAVFDGIRNCANHCCFCFVDMIAPDMRSSLSIKDDDYRLSFLYGNFVTMTNMGPADFKRIAQYHLSPLYVSIQCMNPELRAQMLRCEAAKNIAHQLDQLEAAGADYHTQVVLCAGVNDGPELERTIREIVARRPHALSLAIVPVGLTKYRDDPFPLTQFDAAGAAAVIDEVERWQQQIRAEEGRTFIYLSDEFYFLAGREVPLADYYDGFPQLDNGIGLTRNFICEWERAAAGNTGRAADEGKGSAVQPLSVINSTPAAGEDAKADDLPQDADVMPLHLDVVTGTSVAPVMQRLATEAMAAQPGLSIRLVPVANDWFGHMVNVSGLLTGHDIVAALSALTGPRDGIIIPEPALRAGEDVFLDDISLAALQQAFPDARIEPVQTGGDYYRALHDWPHYHKDRAAESTYTWQSNAGYTKNLTY